MAENTTDLDAVMQAAERLRRANAKWDEDYEAGAWGHFRDSDNRTLADFALSILPKGKRPVAIEQPKVCDRSREWAFWVLDTLDHDVFSASCFCQECIPNKNKRFQCYGTNEDAHTARRYSILAEMSATPFAS